MKQSTQNIQATIAALERMTVAQLQARFLEVFEEPSRSGNRDFLIKRIGWRIQSQAEGSLTERAKRRAEELARDSDIRTTIPRHREIENGGVGRTVKLASPTTHDRLPIPGTVLTRKYRGQQVEVKVLADGFEHEGQTYRSLSAVAKVVTGSHWNGLLFFGLTGQKGNGHD
jgi:hypothetical protein